MTNLEIGLQNLKEKAEKNLTVSQLIDLVGNISVLINKASNEDSEIMYSAQSLLEDVKDRILSQMK